MSFNPLVESISISDLRRFDQEVSTIPNIIKLTLGEPDFPTPSHIKQAAKNAIEEDHSHYTPNPGLPKLRQAAAHYYNAKFNLSYQPDQVITTVGATQAISLAIQTLFQPGDTLLVPTPVFPIYITEAHLHQGSVITLDTSQDQFKITPDKLQATLDTPEGKKIKALVLVYPSNPTGVIYSQTEIQSLAHIIKKSNLWVICDEIYAELTYQANHFSLAQLLPNQVIYITGLSKSHAMTGWRIGFLMGPPAFIKEALKAHQYMVTSTSSISQFAALQAMQYGQNDAQKMLKDYRERRDYLIKILESLGFHIVSKEATFYLFAKIPDAYPQDSWEFVRQVAYHAKVALIPGAAFGPGGESYVRISYAASMDTLKEAMSRIQTFMKQP